jgi:hypothetical protein
MGPVLGCIRGASLQLEEREGGGGLLVSEPVRRSSNAVRSLGCEGTCILSGERPSRVPLT